MSDPNESNLPTDPSDSSEAQSSAQDGASVGATDSVVDPASDSQQQTSAKVMASPVGLESSQGTENFRVDVDQFRGPADLLLYLVRRHEVELTEIALADVTEQYLEYLDILKEIQIDIVGDFIDVASMLVELKARAVLPRNELEQEDTQVDPRLDLVHRLLLYKKFKDASSLLDEHGTQWQNRFARMADDSVKKKVDMAEQPIREVELWDLVSAFGRVLRDNRPKPQANIVYDETPIHVYMKRIHAKIVETGQISFSQLFEPGMHKSAMVGVFLAVLELARHHNVKTEQPELHSEIWMVPSDGFKQDLDVSNVDNYEPNAAEKFKPGDPAAQIE